MSQSRICYAKLLSDLDEGSVAEVSIELVRMDHIADVSLKIEICNI